MAVLAIVGACFISFALSMLPILRPCEWEEELGSKTLWKQINIVAILAAVSSVAIMTAGLGTVDPWKLFASNVAAGVSAVLFVYSAVTDVKLRKVDRRLLNTASLITLATSGAYLATNWNPITAITAGFMIFMGVFVYLFVHSIGASDARVMIFLGTGVIPVVGYFEFMWSIVVIGVIFIFAGSTAAIVKRSMRVSFPAVPMLLGPFWIVLLISPHTALGAVPL